jgi:GntR family transcriptional regulator
LKLWVDRTGNRPIYSQICIQIKRQIRSGSLHPNEMLPSIRSLAKDLRISVITTKHAYEELEREGFLYTVAGKGCFVAKKTLPQPPPKEKLEQLYALLLRTQALARECGLSDSELLEIYQTLKKE